jgi:quercetin dioxygenase-like cupin family protein
MDVWQLARLAPEPSRPEVLRSDDGVARVIALTLPENDLLRDHEVHEHTWMSVLDGTVEISSGSEVIEIGRGALLHFDPGERRQVRATTDARILYLLAPWPGPGHPSLSAS